MLYCLIIALWAYPVLADTANPNADAETARHAALEQRVIAKWESLIQKDFAAAYAMTSPAYRELFSQKAFMRQFGNQVNWRRVEVRDVVFKGDDAAWVGINLYFVYHRAQTEGTLDMMTYVQEPWVQVNGQWWYLMKE